MFERFTQKARQVLVEAREESLRLNHPSIGTEHLLYAVVAVVGSIPSQVLEEAGLTAHGVHEHLASTGTSTSDVKKHPPFTIRATTSLERALRTAISAGHDYIGPEHLLLGLLKDESNGASATLQGLGVDPATVAQVVRERLPKANRPNKQEHTLLDAVRDVGREIRPDLSDAAIEARAVEITREIESTAQRLWESRS